MKLKRKLILPILVFSFAIITNIMAQSGADYFRKGIAAYKSDDYPKAVSLLEDAIYSGYDVPDAKYYAAISYLNLKSPIRALELLEQVSKNNEIQGKPGFPYWMGLAYYQNQEFFKAQTYLDQLSENASNEVDAYILADLRQKVEYATFLHENPNGYYVENMGRMINADGPQYSSVFTADQRTVFYTERKHVQNNAQKGDKLHVHALENIMYATLDENDQWSAPKLLSSDLAGFKKKHQAVLQILENGKKLLLFQDDDLVITELVNGKWSKPQSIGKNINTAGKETHGFITPDGKELYFATNYYSENGALDLMLSRKDEKGEWGKPLPIKELNTIYDEDAPFIAEDGTLYFSSKGHNSMGGFDIFKSTFDPVKGKWSEPENLGHPINSVNDDIFFTIEDKLAYFTSSRSGGYGQEDIYRAYMFENVNLSGIVYDRATGEPVPDCQIRLESEDVVYLGQTDEKGGFQIKLPFHKEYEIKVIEDGELKHQDFFKIGLSLRDPEFAVADIYIDRHKTGPVAAKILLNGKVTSKNEGEAVTAKLKLAHTQNENEILQETNADPDGNYEFELDDVQGNYTVMASHDGYISTSAQLFASHAKNGIIEKNLEMTEVSVGSHMVLQNMYFDIDSDLIKEISYQHLDKLAAFLNENPKLYVEISGHTDSTGSAAYNLQLSERRAKAVVRYLRNKGVNPSNMIAVGYGQTKPQASNDDEKDGRELNRRIELEIVDGNSNMAGK